MTYKTEQEIDDEVKIFISDVKSGFISALLLIIFVVIVLAAAFI